MTADPATAPGLLGRTARAFACVALAYWGAYALVAPVTTIDSQMYNLARLPLALRGGLFGNGAFTSVFHVIFPWSYDALHLPFLQIGWGTALPSFLCLAGTCFIAHAMLRARFGPDAAWVGVLGLLSLTCLVYQGSGTKNDIPLLFAGAVWAYARWRRRTDGGAGHLVWMALALGFMAGAKTSGLVYAFVLSLWTLWELRGSRPLLLRTAAGIAAAGLLWGSVETYAESWRIYGHPLGPPKLLHRMGNADGLRGAVANLTRHAAASVYVGPTTFRDGQTAVHRLVAAERALLAWTGLTDAGTEPRFRDNTLFFTQSGLEELSGFGPTGTLAMALMLLAAVCWRPRAVWWRLAAGGLAVVLLVSLTVAYTPWTNRYLLGAYALGTLAVVAALWESDRPSARSLRWVILALTAAGAVAAPLLSFNRRPIDLVAALTDRERLETSALPVLGQVRMRLRELHAQAPTSRVYQLVNDESLLLPLLEDRSLGVVPVTRPALLRLAASGEVRAGDLIAAENPARLTGLTLIEEVTAPNVYSAQGTTTHYLYRVVGPVGSQPLPLR